MYNPPEVMALLHAIYKSPGDPSKIEELERLLTRYRADFPGQCLLISKPDIPGEMYDACRVRGQSAAPPLAYAGGSAPLRLPASRRLVALVSPIISERRRAVETFLNFRNGSFGAKQSAFANGMRIYRLWPFQ